MVACAPASSAPTPVGDRRRRPEEKVLYQCVREHLPSVLAQAAEADRPWRR
jgi:hypothetical protein